MRSYVNGEFQAREKELILNTKGFEGYPDGLIQSKNPYFFPNGMGNNGSDFTVGAVFLKRGMGNFFKGQIGGLAVFNRALLPKELKNWLSNKYFSTQWSTYFRTRHEKLIIITFLLPTNIFFAKSFKYCNFNFYFCQVIEL